ncbi:YfgG family protein [Pantoea ananatis]|uniref:YfgG family protein n=1 Tax=Pantoea ananas TaxID=553 RepID=UPI001303343B|nr:YfgG family protein [Pantoea ananatis]
MNSALSPRRRKKSVSMTRIVLFISFIILFSRLVFILPAAFEHHQQKQTDSPPAITTLSDSR